MRALLVWAGWSVATLLSAAAPAALNAPAGLNAANVKATSFTLKWSAATGGTGGIASYDIFQDGALLGSATTRSFAVTGLAPVTTYNMTVIAHDGAGHVSPTSETLPVLTVADTTNPTKPADLVATAITTNSFTLTWTAATDNVDVIGYEIHRAGELVGTTPGTTIDLTGLAADTNHRMTVKAVDAAGNLSGASAALVVRTLADPPSAPASLTVANLKTTSFTLKWMAATGGTGGIAGYDVYQDGALLGTTTTRSFVVAGLAPETICNMTVTARDDDGRVSPSSEVLAVTTPPDTRKPRVPAGLVASNLTATSFTLSWTAATDVVGVTGYNIYRAGVLLGSSAGPAFNVTGLTAGSVNPMRVRAVDAAGNLSGASPVLSVTTLSGSANQPPIVELTAPLDGATLTGSNGVVLVADAYDPDGPVAKVEFFSDGIKLGEAAAAPFSFAWSGVPLGVHQLSARVTDQAAATVLSAPVTITVVAAAPAGEAYDFETSEGYSVGPLTGHGGWEGFEEAVLVTGDDAQSGSQSMVIRPPESGYGSYSARLTLAPPSSGETVQFVDFWFKPVADSQPYASSFFTIGSSPLIAFVRAGDLAELQAYQSDEGAQTYWYSGLTVPVAADGTTTQWHRLTLRQDSNGGNRRQDVYLDGQLALIDLNFMPGDQSLYLQGHPSAPTRLDNFRVLADNPLFADADRDGMADAWEAAHGLNPAVNDHDADNNHDGVSNMGEYWQGTNPADASDSDGDGLPDQWERDHFGHLSSAPEGDNDGDGLSNSQEYQRGTNPVSLDTDGDGFGDGQEVALGTDPNDPNSNAPAQFTWLTRTQTLTQTAAQSAPGAGLVGFDYQAYPYANTYKKVVIIRTVSGAPSGNGTFTFTAELKTSSGGYDQGPVFSIQTDDPQFQGDVYSENRFAWFWNAFGGLVMQFRYNAETYNESGLTTWTDTTAQWTTQGDLIEEGITYHKVEKYEITLSKPVELYVYQPATSTSDDSGWNTNTPTAQLQHSSNGDSLTATSTYQVTVPAGTTGTIRWFEVFSPANGGPKQYTLREWIVNGTVSPTFTLAVQSDGSSTLELFDPKVELAVDANRDGIIKLSSEDGSDATSSVKPFSFWINNDDDDELGFPHRDCEDNVINGKKDLDDFFPVFLNIKTLLAVLPPSSDVTYTLKQEDSAVNFHYTDYSRTDAFIYRNLSQSISDPSTQRVTAQGIRLTDSFLNSVKDSDKGVILVEGAAATTKPLVLEVVKNGVPLSRISLSLSIGQRIVLLLHGMNSDTNTWNDFVQSSFGNSAPVIFGGNNIDPTPPKLDSHGVCCYRLQFGAEDGTAMGGRFGLEGISADTDGYIPCGDFEDFSTLGNEVSLAVDELNIMYPNAQIVLVGHSRGGIAARAYLQTVDNSFPSSKVSVIGLLTTGSPQHGSRVGRIYKWLSDNPRTPIHNPETPSNVDWEVVDWLSQDRALLFFPKVPLDVRRPVINDMADNTPALDILNTYVSRMPPGISYGEIVYSEVKLGILKYSTPQYSIFDNPGIDAFPQLSPAAEAYILGTNGTDLENSAAESANRGDGLVPMASQLFSTLAGFPGTRIKPMVRVQGTVAHTDEPEQVSDLNEQLRNLVDWWK